MTPSHPSAPCEPSYEVLFAESLSQINQALSHFLESPKTTPPNVVEPLWEALRYGTLDGGKRIRPVLTLETTLACQGTLATALPTACAIEFAHAQSLIHDDLPCMDNDDLRRGKPTVHKAFGESTAVLAGDALLSMGFGLIAHHTPKHIPAETIVALLGEFSDVTAMNGLVAGQFVDIACEGKPCTTETLQFIHSHKTGALIRFSVRAGAYLAQVEAPTLETLGTVGQHLGLAFQIVDDVLDIEASIHALGKTPGKDQEQQKATYPALYGVSASRDKIKALYEETVDCLNSLAKPFNPERLLQLTQFICDRTH